jgi:asparagine synthase (glutamine-hydrolysing)
VIRHRYWSLEPRADLAFKRDDDWIGHIREAFVRAVTSRMRDVERPGVRLSGGLDSSAVAGAMCAEHPELDIRAFAHVPSGTYPAPADDDAPYLEAVVDRWPNLALRRVASDRFDLLSGPRHWDDLAASPCLDPFQFAVDALSEAQIEDDVDVVLTGEGGDDSLSGYPDTLLIESLLALRFGEAWRELRRLGTCEGYSLMKIARAYLLPPLVPPWMKNAYRSMAGRPWHDELALNQHYVRDRGFLNHLEANGFPYLAAAPLNMGQQLRQRFTPALSPLVAHGDRFAGQRGFQVRHPMHDKDLLQSVCSAPARLMVTAHQDRALIRRVAQPFLPDRVRDRPGKAPFVPEYLVRFEAIVPELKSRFCEFENSKLWSSICDARKPRTFLEQFDRSAVEKSEFGHLMHHVMMPYYLGCFLRARDL